EGKAKSSLNAIKHMMCASIVTLPGEDPERVQLMREALLKEYAPQGFLERRHIEEILAALVGLDRCRDQESNRLKHFAEDQASRREAAEAHQVEQLVPQLAAAPNSTTIRLKDSIAGCLWMRGRWEHLQDTLEAYGFWSMDEFQMALNLWGFAI